MTRPSGTETRHQELADEDFERLLAFRDGLRTFLHWSETRAKAVGLTAMQHQLLLVVRGAGSSPTIGQIAGHLLLRHHSVVELVDRAARAGLVERSHDDEDHRLARVRLTDVGSRKLGELSAVHLEELARLRSTFTPLWESLPHDDGTRS